MSEKSHSIDGNSADFNRILRKQLVSLRLARRLTATEAARFASLSRAGLDKIEAGTNTPSVDSILRLCSLYGVTISSLFRSVEEQLGIAHSIGAEFNLQTAHQEEYREHFRKLALLSGHAVEHETITDLRRITERQPALARALQATIKETARTMGRQRALTQDAEPDSV
jgi:transcriptional regulator with XRE-family HTH domain